MFKYIKSDKFVDDLQVELFRENIMDYPAEEIQDIIIKFGLCRNTKTINYIKRTFADLNKYEHTLINQWDEEQINTYYGKSKEDIIFCYNSKRAYVYISNKIWQSIDDLLLLTYIMDNYPPDKLDSYSVIKVNDLKIP